MWDKILSVFTGNGFEQALCNEEGTVKSKNFFSKRVGALEFKVFVSHEELPMRFSFETFLNDERICNDIDGLIFENSEEIQLYLSRVFEYNAAINNIRFDNVQSML